MTALGTIGQALYMRLFFHLANLYDEQSPQRLIFQKRYDDICTEWLGGLTILAHRSKIIGEQLGRHLDQLVSAGFLQSYLIEPARTQRRAGFTLTFRPGPMFFDDYNRFYCRKQSHRGSGIAADREETSEPLKAAYLFAEKRTGHPIASIPFVPSKDVETAKQLLRELPAAGLPAFLDYALAEARKTNFDIQTLGGVKQYLTGYLARRSEREADKIREVQRHQREALDAERQAYDAFRRAQALDIFANLPEEERATIEAEAAAHAAKFSGPLRDSMVKFSKARFTTARHGEKLTPFGQWKKQRSLS